MVKTKINKTGYHHKKVTFTKSKEVLSILMFVKLQNLNIKLQNLIIAIILNFLH